MFGCRQNLMNKLLQITLVVVTSTLNSGCGGEEEAANDPSATPPPATLDVAQPQGQNPLAPTTEVKNDPQMEAKAAVEENAALEARIKAGEVGTTPDPVEDKWLGVLDSAYNSYYSAFNKPPDRLEDLVKAGYLRMVPTPPKGKKYIIVPEGGGIELIEAK